MTDPWWGEMPNGSPRPYGGHPYPGVWSEEDKRYIIVRNGKTYRIARLVCEAFHGPQPADKPYVLHGDEDSTNNRPENLSWGTQKENLNAPGFVAYCKSRTGVNSPTVKGRRKTL